MLLAIACEEYDTRTNSTRAGERIKFAPERVTARHQIASSRYYEGRRAGPVPDSLIDQSAARYALERKRAQPSSDWISYPAKKSAGARYFRHSIKEKATHSRIFAPKPEASGEVLPAGLGRAQGRRQRHRREQAASCEKCRGRAASAMPVAVSRLLFLFAIPIAVLFITAAARSYFNNSSGMSTGVKLTRATKPADVGERWSGGKYDHD